MATCGYLCPACNGSGFVELDPCTWCASPAKTTSTKEATTEQKCSVQPKTPEQKELELEEWLNKVHEGPCCGDWK